MSTVLSFQQIIDSIENLSLEDQDYLFNLIRKRRIEQRRSEIAANAQATIESFKKGTTKRATIDDLIADLLNDDDLDSSTLEHLSESLKVTTLNNIIKTIRLIKDRNRFIAQLKTLVFDWEKLGTNEREHIQKFVENHYWIIGEQYHLVTAAEPKFEEAMRRYIYILKGEKPVISIDHPDKNKEMDIFMIRQLFNNCSINNVVLELKHPKITLGSKELDQVKTYMNVIMEQDVFNASNMSWEFYLIGNNFNKYITNEIESSKYRGEKSLVHWNNKYKIYVKTWSEIFTEFDLKHKFLKNKLELDKAKLNIIVTNANEVINNIHTNSAVQPTQRAIPQN